MTDKDFEALRGRLIALVQNVFPDWTDFAVASFGNILLELYAFVGDVITYYLDNQARGSQLVTATQRKNVIALAAMLGYRLPGASAATAEVVFSLAQAAAAHWTLLTLVAAERIAAFRPAPARAWEDFERWSELQLVLEPSDLAIGFFDPRSEGLEDFEEAWGNDHYHREWPTGQGAECPFDDGSVEDLERGWRNDRFLDDWTELAALVGLFDGEPQEEFEEAWLANETFVTAWTERVECVHEVSAARRSCDACGHTAVEARDRHRPGRANASTARPGGERLEALRYAPRRHPARAREHVMPTLELPALVIEEVDAIAAPRRLALINRDPCPGELAVPIDTTICLDLADLGGDATGGIDRTGDATGGIDRTATQVFVDSVLAFDGSAVAPIRPGFDGPRAAVTQTADMLRLVLDPMNPLASEATVRLRVRSSVVGGAAALDELYSFVVEDRTAPRATAAQAFAPRQVQIGFDEPVVLVDPHGFRFVALDRPAVPVTPIDAVAHGTVVRVDLDTELTPDARYQVTITGVADPSGNPVLAPFDQVGFVGFRPARPASRRFDLWTMLPKYNRRADATGDAQRLFVCLQEVTDLLLAESAAS